MKTICLSLPVSGGWCRKAAEPRPPVNPVIRIEYSRTFHLNHEWRLL